MFYLAVCSKPLIKLQSSLQMNARMCIMHTSSEAFFSLFCVQVLCAVLRLFVAVMQSPAASVRWASHLRGSDRFWACIQSVIEQSTGDQSDKPSSQFAASYAWHIVCLETTRHPRLPSGEQATTPPSKVWPVLEKLISKRLVHKVRYKYVIHEPFPRTLSSFQVSSQVSVSLYLHRSS
jgi:hypothetical protein